jgi:hypothetical protein
MWYNGTVLYREQFVTTVKLGCVMAVDASPHMPAHALCKMLYVLNASAKCGIMVDASSAVLFAQASFARMISLNIRLLVRS